MKFSSVFRLRKSTVRSAVRLTKTALTLGWKAMRTPITSANGAGRIVEIADFGSNPGALRMHVFAPTRPLPRGAALIVVLHGCGQQADAFAIDAGWRALAENIGAALLLPEQTAGNNPGRCFNWFRPADTRRGAGEAMSIRQMVRVAIDRFGSDRKRIFIVGLSAGGAMAASMLAAYPAVFAAGAVVAGMPVGAADSQLQALRRMRRADAFRGRQALATAVRAASPARGKASWPRLSIWQGGRDRTIDPANADVLAAQWISLHGLDAISGSEMTVAPGITRQRWGRATRPAVELWTIARMGHGFPVDPSVPGGGREGVNVLDAGVAGASAIAAFWGISFTSP